MYPSHLKTPHKPKFPKISPKSTFEWAKPYTAEKKIPCVATINLKLKIFFLNPQKVGKSRNFGPKVGKSRKASKSRKK